MAPRRAISEIVNGMKTCTRCVHTLPVAEFGNDRTSPDLLTTECKKCKVKRGQEWYRRNKAKVARSDRDRRIQKLSDPVVRAQHNKECLVRCNARRVKKQNVPGSHTLEEWEDLCELFNNCCGLCRQKKPLSRDHIIPITWPDSSDDIINIQPLCRECNAGKGNRYAAHCCPCS